MTRLSPARIRAWASEGESHYDEPMNLIAEEPLSIRVQGRPYMVVMRTPGEELAHAAGLCLAEGLIHEPADIAQLAFCDGVDTNTVTVMLQGESARRLERKGDRRAFVSQTGCGLCGKELIEDLHTEIHPIEDSGDVPISVGLSAISSLGDNQPLRAQTRAAHAAALHDRQGRLLTVAEDVGRHNALDKAIGRLFLDHQLSEAHFVALSSRISYELVQKAACARIPVIVAVSRPTSLAVALARRLNMTLASRKPGGGLWVYCGTHRIRWE